jgi:hypothetical protein
MWDVMEITGAGHPHLDAFAEESALFEKCFPESLPTTLPISGPYGLFGRGMV